MVYRHGLTRDCPLTAPPPVTPRRYYDGKALLYPMGHGLSYTSFTLEEAAASSSPNDATPLSVGVNMTVELQVKNIGAVDGDEVILALFVPLAGTVPVGAPAARLKQQMFAFERVSVVAGEATTVRFEVNPDMIELYADTGDRMIYPGRYSRVH